MVKEPRPGRVKTRLGRDIGMVRAAWWFRHQVEILLRKTSSPKWETILAVAPDHAGLTCRVWPQHFPRIAQGPGNLGDRMARVFRSLPPGPVCVIGGDVPGVNNSAINAAFKKLGNHDAVFGPAMDGGYWLVGLKRSASIPAGFLENVRWSTEHALSDSINSFGRRKIGLAQQLGDVDTAADLVAMQETCNDFGNA